MKRSILTVLWCGLPTLSSGVQGPIALEPGLYEVRTTDPETGAGGTRSQCITADDVARGLEPHLDPSCRITRSTIGDGRVAFAATCPASSIVLAGTYTTTSYVIDGELHRRASDGSTLDFVQHHVGTKVADTCSKP